MDLIHRHDLVIFSSAHLEVCTLKYKLFAIAVAVAGRGEVHRGLPSCPKSTEVPTAAHLIKMLRAGTLSGNSEVCNTAFHLPAAPCVLGRPKLNASYARPEFCGVLDEITIITISRKNASKVRCVRKHTQQMCLCVLV